MGSSSYLTAMGTVMTKSNQISDLEMRLVKISAEKTLKHTQGCGQVSEKTNQMNAELNILKEELGEDYDSEEYKQYMAEAESVENEYTTQIEALRDQMNEAETKLDTQQETVEVQLEAQRSELEEWQKLASQKAGSAGYFDSGSGK